ncbi:MAG: peptidoglycan DD-metalloendopeptidase family protein [Halioglobus sp.]
MHTLRWQTGPGARCAASAHPVRGFLLALTVLFATILPVIALTDTVCTHAGDCGTGEACHGASACGSGVCVPAFTLPRFVIDLPGLSAYTADMQSVLDHTGPFYQRCCDTNITAYTGESADRDENAILCPAAPVLPGCFFANCQCGFRDPGANPFVVSGSYSSPFGPQYLYYAGHPGYDYNYGFGTALVAPADGMLCKAIEDPVNGRFGFASGWDAFHSFYIDHGAFAGRGYATWYLHAADLEGQDTNGGNLQSLAPGQCAPVAAGQLVARVGNTGTLLPHLHFEVRAYELADGPEAPSARIIDPYGWRGSQADPWANPLENPQAESQLAPLWIACGNGRKECGEACDDGNLADGDGCSASCVAEDADGDGVVDALDNCPLIPNPDQLDSNNNGRGDACEGLPPGC